MVFLKRCSLLFVLFLYLVSTFLQTSTTWFSSRVYAQSSSERTNIVAVLVDTEIYGSIKGDISRYANTYVPQQSPGTELVVLPLDPSGFESHDVYRILENLYFDGKSKESTRLVGTIVFGDIPLPLVDFNDEQFMSLHPYTDFEGPPMFRFDDGRGLWVTNDSSFSQPEIRHALIPGRDIDLFSTFFKKLKKYHADPKAYAVPEIRYDDYQMMQSSYQHDSLDPYLNNLLLSFDRSSHSINRTMTDLVNKEYGEDMVEEIDNIVSQYEELKGQPFPDDATHPDVEDANARIESGVGKILDFFTKKKFKEALGEIDAYKTDADFGVSQSTGDSPIPTLLNAKQIENMFRSSYSVFGDELLSDMEDNLASGGRYDIPQIDTSLNIIQLNDKYAQEYLMKTNLELEQSLDKLIQERQYMLKYPIPTWYEHWISSSPIQCAPDRSSSSSVGGADKMLESRYENFYYGRYAGDVQQYDDLHVYRGDYSNKGITDLLGSKIPVVPLEDIPFDFYQAAMGSSFGGFTQQVKSMRGSNFDIDNVGDELELYENTKCGDEDIEPWTKKFWGGASPADLDLEALEADATNITFNPTYYAEDYMWNPTTNRTIGGPQYTPKGAVEMKSEKYTSSQLRHKAQEEFSESQRVDFLSRAEYNSLDTSVQLPSYISARRAALHCQPRLHKTFDFHDFFRVYEQELPEPSTKKVIHVSQNPIERGGGVDQFLPSSLSHPQIDDVGLIEANRTPRFKELNISDGRDLMSDMDEDLIPDDRDKDKDGDSIENEDDGDIDGDGIQNLVDNDQDNDGTPNRGDIDTDGDMVPNPYDGDADQDGLINYPRNDQLGDQDPNATGSKDTDPNGCSCGGGGSCGRCNKQSLEDFDPTNEPPLETELPQLDSGFDYLVKNAGGDLQSLGSSFDSDYLVVQLSDSECFYCRQLASKIEESTELQNQLSTSCDYTAVVSNGNLNDWLGSIGGRKTFVGKKSAEMTDGSLRQMEHLFKESKSLAGIPHVFIVNKSGTIVSRAMGDLPQDLSSYCPVPNDERNVSASIDSLEKKTGLSGIFTKVISLFSSSVFAQGSPSGFTPGVPYVYDVREVSCPVLQGGADTYQDRHYWDYHIIDTVVQHKGATNHMLNQSHVLTMERPINDAPYTSFHGIGGDLVSFIYPNMYNTTTYQGTLLDESTIEQNIRIYLRTKVARYNSLLQDQLAAAPGYYAQHPAAYDFLAQTHSSATPNRTYDLIPETFFEDILGPEKIKRIAHWLYYMSYPREEKPSGSTVAEYLDNARKGFDMDRKLEYVSELYLLSSPGLPEKFADDQNLLPRYVDPVVDLEKRKAYEIAYINSDSRDSLPTQGTETTFLPIPERGPETITEVGTVHEGFTQATLYAQQDDTECNIPKSGAVPLLERPDAFACWVKKTTENPINFELYIGVEADVLGVPGALKSRAEDWKQFGEDVGIKKNDGNESDTEESLGRVLPDQGSLFSSLFPSVFAIEINDARTELSNSIDFSLSPEGTYLSDGSSIMELVITPRNPLGNVTLTLSAPGANDIFVNNVNISQSAHTFSLNLGESPQSFPVSVSGSESGNQNINISYCASGTPVGSDACVQKSVGLFVAPGNLESFTVTPVSSVMMSGVPVPILIQGVDASGNPLPFPPQGTEISLQGGVFPGGISSKSLTSTVGALEYVIPDDNVSELTVTISRVLPSTGLTSEYTSSSFDVTPFSLEVDPTVSLRLPSKEDGFTDLVNGKSEVVSSRLPQISFSFPSITGVGDGFTIPFEITGGEGIVRPGYIDAGIFRGSNDFIQEGSESTILLMPTGVAGTTELTLRFPGGYTKNISVVVEPSGPEKLDFEFSQNGSYRPGDTVHGQVIVSDSRGNLFTDDAQIDLEAVGGWDIFDDKIISSGGVAAFSGTARTGGSCGCRGKTRRSLSGPDDDSNQDEASEFPDENFETTTYGSAEFEIQNITRPDDRASKKQDINAMYLVLHGQDRGNEQRVVDMLKNNKTLAISTSRSRQGDQEFQDKKTAVSANGMIDDELGLVKEMRLEGEHLFVDMGYDAGVGRIYLGSTEELGLAVRTRDFEDTPAPDVQISPLVGSCYQEKNVVYVDGGAITAIDFEYGFMHEDIHIIPEKEKGNRWIVTYKNEPVASLVLGSGSSRFSTSLNSREYLIENESAGSVVLGFRQINAGGNDISYAGVTESSNSKNNVGMRHNANGVTNFVQGQPVGVANQWYSDPRSIVFGDPFLKRIDKSANVRETDFDAGIGQVLYSSQAALLKVDSMDVDGDGKEDMIMGYEDGTIRLLKNDGGGQPFSPIGSLLVIADGIKDFKAGDVDGDGMPDLVVTTKTDKARVYKNNNGVLEIDGWPVCLDIPNGEYGSLAQTNQVFIDDVNNDAILDFVVYAIDGELEVFYGGGNSYISTNPNKCDKDAISRNKRELLKSIKLSTGRTFADKSLIHRAGLELPPEDADEISVEGYAYAGEEIQVSTPSIKTKRQAKNFVQQLKTQVTDRYQTIDHSQLIQEGYGKTIDYLLESPVGLRPRDQKSNPAYAFMQTVDLAKSDSAKASVSKVFIDQNGGYVEKGDILTVQTTISGSGPFDYLEKLDEPVIIFKDEFNVIPTFESSVGGEIDWNIGQGYEFRITGANPGTFTYEVMFNGNGHARIELETDLKGVFQEEGTRTTGAFNKAYAQGGGNKIIKLFMDDACYKAYREFDTNETMNRLTKKYEASKKDFFTFFDDQRKQAEVDLTDPDFGMIKKMMGIHEVDFDPHVRAGVESIVKNLQAGHTLSLDLGTEYLDGYADMLEAGMKGLCKGIKFGETNCGGLPVPFNMAALSPGTANVFGCKLFEDPGMPVLAFPTTGPVPMWPIFPTGAGGYFGTLPEIRDPITGKSKAVGGKNSKFRLYLSPTTTNGLGIAICGAGYKQGMNIPSPIGDIAGNCVVIAGPVGPSCDDGGDAYSTPSGTQKDKHLASLDQDTYDLHNLGSCNPAAQESSGFISSLSNGPVAMVGKALSVVADTPGSIKNYGSFGGGGNTQKLLSFDKYTLRGGTEIDLSITGGDVKGMVQCIVRKRFDNQIRYVANNLLSMQLTVLFPDFDKVTEGMDAFSWSQSVANIKSGFEGIPATFKKVGQSGSRAAHMNAEDEDNNYFLPRSVLNELETAFTNPFEEMAMLFDAIPLVDVRQKRVRLQIPFMFEEDLVALKIHLTNRVERNEALLEERENLRVDSLDVQANKDQIISEMKPTIRAVRKNLTTLEAYTAFPTKLYEFVHGRDQYIDEVYSFTDDVLRQLTGWLQENANRYSKYVDTIILLVGIIETRQPLIDFSTNRKTKCAKCTNDNYDYYSCKLSMLCVDLPLLPIPPFRLPNITLDFSQINLGIDIMLPKFVFLPEKINYPRLPDLPDPQNFSLNLDVELFDVPLIPSPPSLPTIPKLKLDAELQMPNLPPAIKIPHIFPGIKIMVKAADFIGTIFCIFKEGKGLVAEQSVKTRIEQLTQRQRSVEPFDSLSVTLPDTPLEGFDYKIDAMLDLKLSFDELYDVFDSIAETVNDGVAGGMENLKKRTSDVQNGISSGIRDVIDTDKLKQINNGVDIDIGVDLSSTNIPLSRETRENKKTTFDRPVQSTQQLAFHETYHRGGDPDEVRERLKDELSYLISREDLDAYHDDAKRITSLISSDANLQANVLGIEGMQRDVTSYMQGEQRGLKNMKELIQDDFILFLDQYGSDQLLVDAEIGGDESLRKQFSTSLFTADSDLISYVSNKEHPLETYLDYQEPIVAGYKKALDKYTAQNLNMSDLIYQGSKDYINGLAEKIIGDDQGRILLQPFSTQSETTSNAKKETQLLLAQTDVDVDNDNNDESTSSVTVVDESESISGETGEENLEVLLSPTDENCIPLDQDDDIDDDGIPNQQDIIDVDGDGIPNTIDPDIDGDCLPNTTDPDIDGDTIENGADRDCNCNGRDRSIDDDDDSDGLPDDEDPDDDNDGIPDEEDTDDQQQDQTENGSPVSSTSIPNQAEKTGLDLVDPSSYIEGLFIPGDDEKQHNVMHDTKHANDVWKKNNVLMVDMNGDNNVDIVSRDAHDIFIKYANQNDVYPGASGGGMVELGPWSSADQLEEEALQDDGYVNNYKLRDEKDVRQDAYREGNNYASMGFSRENSEEDAYIVSLTHKADLHHRADGSVNSGGTGSMITYALALPQGFTTEGIEIEIPKELEKNMIDEYIEDDTIQQVLTFDGGADRINSFLENLPPEWYFAQIAPLRLIKDEGTWYYKRVGPWSRQIVSGSQKRGDDQNPTLNLELIRMKTGESVAQGVELGGYVQTDYAFSGTRTDNGEVLENTIIYNDKIIYVEEEGGKVWIELGEKYEVPTVESFQFIAKDQADNVSVVDVVVRIESPTIDITTITDRGAGYDVETELSETIDEGDVAFFVDRFGWREQLNPFTFPVKVTDPTVIGGLYITDEAIGMHDSQSRKRATIDTTTAKINVEPGMESLTDIKIDFSLELPEVSVIDNESGNSLFSIGLTASKRTGIDLLNGAFDQVDLDRGLAGSYVGGACFKKPGGECEIFVDIEGNVTIPKPFNSEYEGVYSFDDESRSVVYTIQDSALRDIVRVEFIANPLEG